MDLVFYWNAFKHWFWVLLLTVAITLAGIYYLERQRGRVWQGQVSIQVDSPYALTPTSYNVEGAASDSRIAPQFDFTNVANSANVATRVIQALNLPQQSPQTLFQPPAGAPTWPSVQAIPGDPAGDAASAGLLAELLGGAKATETTPKTHTVVVRSTTYENFGGEQLARDLADTFAREALQEWRQINLAAAQNAYQQALQHAQRARDDYQRAQQELSSFLTANNLAPGGTDFQTIQQSIDQLLLQRANLVSAARSQEQYRAQAAEVDAQIAELERQVERDAEALGARTAAVQAERARLQGLVDSARKDYEEAFRNQEAARQEVTRIAAQGYPAERTSTTVVEDPGSRTDVSTESHTAPSVETSNSNSTSSVPDQVTTTTSNTRSTSHTEGETDAENDNRDSEMTRDTEAESTTTTTSVRQGSTTTTTSTTTTNRPGADTTVRTTSRTAPSTQVSTVTSPVEGITSEAQATYYLGTLQFATQARQAALQRALAELAAFDRSDPTPALANQLSLNRSKLESLRQTRQALQLAAGDTAAGLEALDQMIAEKRERLAQLAALQPRFNELQANVEAARSRMERLDDLAAYYDRLQQDAAIGAGAYVAMPVQTFRGASRQTIELVFGFLISFLVGTAFMIGLEYIRYSRNAMRARAGLYGVPALPGSPAVALPGTAFQTPLPGHQASAGETAALGRRLVLPDTAPAQPRPEPPSKPADGSQRNEG